MLLVKYTCLERELNIKKLHKKSKWITSGILRSINKKDKLYKPLIQTDIDNTGLYERI